MTIEQAIEHAEQVANSYNDTVPECECAKEHRQLAAWLRELQERRKAPEIVFCKDCAKHNVDMRDSLYIEKARECPLIHYRGKAQGHEFDYQYCVCAERKTDV